MLQSKIKSKKRIELVNHEPHPNPHLRRPPTVVANRGVGFVTRKWWVSFEIWMWKLGVGEEALSPIHGDLAGDESWVGLGRVMEARVWLGVFSLPVRKYQSKRLKLFYIISCFVCLIRCFKKTTLNLFNLLIGYLLLIRWQCE